MVKGQSNTNLNKFASFSKIASNLFDLNIFLINQKPS